ncbi:hypothetical protein [Succinimonas sp.]|uniref:hypothetical protein n=1 Tax=Succinimonas sp. TaxID=1936151 RepID=UPI00386A67A8
MFASEGAGHVLAKILVYLTDADVVLVGTAVFPAILKNDAKVGVRNACRTYPQDIFTAGSIAGENHPGKQSLRWQRLETAPRGKSKNKAKNRNKTKAAIISMNYKIGCYQNR